MLPESAYAESSMCCCVAAQHESAASCRVVELMYAPLLGMQMRASIGCVTVMVPLSDTVLDSVCFCVKVLNCSTTANSSALGTAPTNGPDCAT